MRKRGLIGGLPTYLIALAAFGCGSADKPIAVEGVVRLDGEPLAGATVTFMSTQNAIRPASGYSDAQGVFHLTSLKKDDGALRGEYRVIVTKIQAIKPPPDTNSGDPDAVFNHYKSLKSQDRMSLLPILYASYDTTPLRCKVPAEGKVALELEGSPRAP